MKNKDGLDIENPLRVPKPHFGKPFHSLTSSNDLTERHKRKKEGCSVFLTLLCISLTNRGVNEYRSF